jgi:hypothetical protein
MRYLWTLFLALGLATLATAQTSTVRKPVKSKALIVCEEDLANSRADAQYFDTSFRSLSLLSEQTKKESEGVKAKNADLEKQLAELRAVSMEVLKYGLTADTEIRKILTDYNSLIEKYNTLLERANTALAQANAKAERQRQFNNALAIYSVMPKYTPTYLPPPPRFGGLQMNCTSRTVGGTVFTDCN